MGFVRSLVTIATAAAAALALTACGSGADAPDSSPASPVSAAAITATDLWARAAGPGENTAVFGVLTNTSGAEAVLASVTSDAAASSELHEMAMTDSGQHVMREVEEGFRLAPGGALSLEPGGNHLMLMGLTDALEPGQTVTLTLTLSDGSTLQIEALVKDVSGGDEQYEHDAPGSHDS